MAVELLRRRFTLEDYRRMIKAGILSEDDRVELIEGEVVNMTPVGSRHAACVNRLAGRFISSLGAEAIVSVQNPVQLGSHSEPQPDLTLLRPRADFYAEAHPGPEDILLVVEVAETSAEADRNVKIPLYARAGVPEAWLVDLAVDRVEVFRSPTSQGYGHVRQLHRGGSLCPEAFPGRDLEVSYILG